MISNILAVRDIKGEVWGQPYCVNNIGAAVRSYMDMCKEEKDQQGNPNPFLNHKNDFELWHLGTYDDSDATIGAFSPTDRRRLVAGSDL